MLKWIELLPDDGFGVHRIVNLDRITLIKWETGTLYLCSNCDSRKGTNRITVYDPDKKLFESIKKQLEE